jgi:hypothetical protein
MGGFMCNLSDYLNDDELKSLGRYALFIVRNVYPKRRTAEGTFTVDINKWHMQKMIELINVLEWFQLEVGTQELNSIQKILDRLEPQKISVSESYLKSLINEAPK